MYFNDEHEMFRQTVRRFVDQEINPHVDEWEEAGIFPAHELFTKMGDLGFLGLTYPEEYGGLDLDFWYTVVFCEELGRTNCSGVPMGITVHTDMCTPALAHFGSPELKQQFLEPSIRGEYGRLHRRLRAGRWLRRGGHPHARRGRWRRVGHYGPQALHHQRRAGGLGLPAGAHQRRGLAIAACR